MGAFGVAVATAAAICICGGMNVLFARHNEFLRLQPFLRQIPVFLTAGAVCVAIILWGNAFWQEKNAFVRLVLIGLSAMAGYFAVALPMLIRLQKG